MTLPKENSAVKSVCELATPHILYCLLGLKIKNMLSVVVLRAGWEGPKVYFAPRPMKVLLYFTIYRPYIRVLESYTFKQGLTRPVGAWLGN